MNIKTDENGTPVNVDMVNRKLESFVEVVLQKMIVLKRYITAINTKSTPIVVM